jgi:uncharacterized OB-fold protein
VWQLLTNLLHTEHRWWLYGAIQRQLKVEALLGLSCASTPHVHHPPDMMCSDVVWKWNCAGEALT